MLCAPYTAIESTLHQRITTFTSIQKATIEKRIENTRRRIYI